MAEAIVAKNYAIMRSVPSDSILTEASSKITEQNLSNAKIIAGKFGLESFLIVSDPLHMKRAMLIAKDLKLSAYPAPTPTTMYRTWYSKTKFLLREVYFYIGYALCRPFRYCRFFSGGRK